MLIKVRRLNYQRDYAYAPPQEDAVINTEDVVQAYPTEARGPGPFTLVKFRDGTSCTIAGTLDQLVPDESALSREEVREELNRLGIDITPGLEKVWLSGIRC